MWTLSKHFGSEVTSLELTFAIAAATAHAPP